MDDYTEVAPEEGFNPETTETSEPDQQAEETSSPPETEQAAPPPQPTVEELLRQQEERLSQKWQSWTGRRDQDLLSHVAQVIDSRLRDVRPPAPEQPAGDPAALLENPDNYLRTVVPKILHEEINRVTRAEQTYTADIIRNAGELMNNDPLFSDTEFGTEVVKEIQKNFSTLDKSIAPAMAARLLVAESIATVNRRKLGQKVNPLANNTPGKAPGNQTPPAAPPPSVKVPKLDPYTERWAKKWGYKDEDLVKLYGASK